MTGAMPGAIEKVQSNIVLRLVLYYAMLAIVAVVLLNFLPAPMQAAVNEAVRPLLGMRVQPQQPAEGNILDLGSAAAPMASGSVLIMALIGSVTALLLAVPISWTYMFTKQKKGYQQATVQSLILLPVVVALVAAVVQNSVALAFSLAGVVAAVRFRVTLDDSKDAVFVFAVMAMGLASGVSLEIASVLSVLFVSVTLVLWYTDYARTPPSLEGERAQKHMERALAIANRTSQFVARLDKEILDSMAPAQLEALQSRLDKRRSKIEKKSKGGDEEEEGPRFEGRLNIKVSDPDAAQSAVEGVLQAGTKRYKMIRMDRSDGEALMVYAVRPKKGESLEGAAQLVERDGAPYVASVEVERWA